MKKFDTLQDFSAWLNENDERIADGVIKWQEIQNAVEASGWEFNAAKIYIAYDNTTKSGVKYEVQRNGKEIAIVV